MRRPKPSRRLLVLLGVAALGVVVVVGPAVYVRQQTAGLRYTVGGVPSAQVAIVFGAGIKGGQPSPFLARRLDIAVQLYAQGRVRALLMSGDNSRTDYDEVGAMTAYAVERGVPAAVIAADHAGFDTYDSCYRARAIFGVSRAIVVTQSFHLARATFVCRQLGIEAVGVGDDTSHTWPALTRKYQAREMLSTAKALWESRVTHPEPKFLGPRETSLDAVLSAAPAGADAARTRRESVIHSVDNSWG